MKSDSELLTCWLFSQNSFSCVLFQREYLSEADARKSVKTKVQKQKSFHYVILLSRKAFFSFKGTLFVPLHYLFLFFSLFNGFLLKQRQLLLLKILVTLLEKCQQELPVFLRQLTCSYSHLIQSLQLEFQNSILILLLWSSPS